jgi:D-alanyl-D-alanine-carboxypeptidase/D-alanyl-D-alanine-endopeptidase
MRDRCRRALWALTMSAGLWMGQACSGASAPYEQSDAGPGSSGPDGALAPSGADAATTLPADGGAAFNLAPVPDPELEAKVRAILEPITGQHPGMVVGIIRDGKVHVVSIGEVKKGSGEKPTAKTVFELGSLSKAFTGLLLASAEVDKQVALDDDVQSHLPADKTVLQLNGKPITLRSLMAHTSGIRRDLSCSPLGELLGQLKLLLIPKSMWEKSVADMYSFLATCAPSFEPGTKFSYSNVGVSLLGLTLADLAGTSWETLVVKTVTDVLDMPDTRVFLGAEQTARRATGYSALGIPVTSQVDSDACYIPAGGLQTTLADMLRYLAAQLGLLHTPLDTLVDKSHTTLTNAPGDSGKPTAYGYGWMMNTDEDGVEWLGHAGATTGFMSVITFAPAEGKGLVVLSNGYSMSLVSMTSPFIEASQHVVDLL